MTGMQAMAASVDKGRSAGSAEAVVESARLMELRAKAAALRQELLSVEQAIEKEEGLLKAAAPAGPTDSAEEPPPQLHHRPSWSLLGGAEEPSATPAFLRQLSASDQDFDAVLKDHPELHIAPIGAYNHWDRRECAVTNAAEWKARCERYSKELGGPAEIPKVIHQIWIGPKEPPCLWIDTFRVDYIAAHPEWGFELWSDEQVAKLPMINEQIYTEEKMWQCKADILRLEMLWHHGGLYVDADMISVENKSLDPIIELGRETGWVIAYEPDTKDKPYSILGNSVIACTPHHPLTLMLILYLKQTYYPKRHVIEVFAVTGPVMYTKCLVDTGMPISVADQELLYPAFHFVPNPDAIDFSRFPKCLMFQFGYTCSGLEGYVKSKNKCKKARMCHFHSKKEWPLGAFRELPTAAEVEEQYAKAGKPAAPCVVHQLVLDGVDGPGDPLRWRQTWFDGFKRSHPQFQYRTWTKKELQGRKWFCANLYVPPFDDQAVTALMLEVLFEEGGYYAPLSTIYRVGQGSDPFFANTGGADFVEGAGGVFGAARGSPGCFRRLMKLYDQGQVGPMLPTSPSGPCVIPMGFRDGLIARAHFKAETKFLGAAQILALATGSADARAELAAIAWAYECQVPCFCAKGPAGMRAAVAEGGPAGKTLFVLDKELFQMERLVQEAPGLIGRVGAQAWDILLLGVEWSTGSSEVVLFNVPMGGRPRNCKVAGFVANFESARNLQALRATLAASITEDGFDPSPLFEAAGQLSLWFGAEKYAGTIEEARILRSMPTVHRVFEQIARHQPPMHYDRHELHGNLMKGFLHGRLRFEMVLEPSSGVMFRAWNDDNSTNCEMKTNGAAVEWMKVYYNHQVSFEAQNKPIP